MVNYLIWKKSIGSFILLTLLSICITGCGLPDKDTSMVGEGLQNTSVYPASGPKKPIAQKWLFRTNGQAGSPTVAGGSVFAMDSEGYVYALDAKTGKKKWRTETGGGPNSLIVLNGVVYVSGRFESYISALNAENGKEKWRFEPKKSGGNFSSISASNESIYFVKNKIDSPAYLYSISRKNGKKRWRTRVGSNASSPAVSDGMIYVGSIKLGGSIRKGSYGYIYAINGADGKEKWSFRTSEGMSSPAVAHGKVFAGSQEGDVYALDMKTGKKLWRSNIDYGKESPPKVRSSPSLTREAVYFTTTNLDAYNPSTPSSTGGVHAMSAETGKDIWIYETRDEISVSPSFASGAIYTMDDDGIIYSIDGDNGEKKWEFKTSERHHSSPAISNEVVYVGNRRGIVALH